jgi:recombination protein RecR
MIGPRTSQKIAFYIINKLPKEVAIDLANTIKDAKTKIKYCPICNFMIEDECEFCNDKKRDKTTICVVEKQEDVFAIEKTNIYKGVYHILNGLISPLDGIGPKELTIDRLIERVEKTKVNELIIAFSPSTEGEATLLYLLKLLKPFQIKISRLAHGIPQGAELQATDEITLSKAIQFRQII